MNLYELASLGMEADAQPLYRPAPRAMAADAGDIAGPPTRAFAVPQALDPLFEAAAADYGVDASILKGIAHAESRFRPDIISGHTRSRTGALGLMQFMPDTARELGIDPLDPVQSVFGAAAYLRESLDRFGGDTERAIASYNWGRNRTAFDRDDWYKALPAETRNYVGAVLDFADGAVPTPGPAALLHGAKVPLPEGVQPSQAGGGRGMVNPPAQRSEAVAGPNAPKKSVFERVGGELAQLRDELFSGSAGVSANFQAMNASAAANQLLQRQDALKKLEQAGKGEGAEALGLRKYITHATARLGGMAADAADAGALADAAGRMTTRPELRAVTEAKSLGESWEAFKKNPYAVVAGVTAQSAAQMIPMIVAAATTGPVGGAAVAGGTSALSEFGSSIREFARDNGVDPSDKDGLGKLFSDPKMLREAMAYAGKGGAIVGTMDAVSGGLAGKTLVPKVFKNQAVRQAINAPLQAGVQAALGGAGEAGKQLAQKGQIDQPGQVLAEMVGEWGMAPVEVLALSKDARQVLAGRNAVALSPAMQVDRGSSQSPVGRKAPSRAEVPPDAMREAASSRDQAEGLAHEVVQNGVTASSSLARKTKTDELPAREDSAADADVTSTLPTGDGSRLPGAADGNGYRPSGNAISTLDPETVKKARILQGEPVAILLGNEAPRGFALLRAWASKLFADAGGVAVHPELGEVVLDERAVRDSMAHGMNPSKAVSFAAVKAVVEGGALVLSAQHDRDATSFYISAPVEIDEKGNVVTVLVKKDPNTQRMYLHSVSTKERLLNTRYSGTDTKDGVERSGKATSGDVASVIRGLLTVNLKDVSGDASSPAMEPEVPTAGPVVDAPTAVPVGAMHLTDKGTLSVEGDPRQLDKRLRDAGVDQVWMWLDSVWVGPEQAARAQQVLAQPQPGADADAERQSPPPAQMKMREGGMLDVEGDTQAVRQWLEDAGIPGGAMTDGPEGVIVTAGSVERAKQALAGPGASLASTEQLPIAQSANPGGPAVPLQDGRSGSGGLAPVPPLAGTGALITEGSMVGGRAEAPPPTTDPNNNQTRAVRKPPPVQMSMLADGRLDVKGDTQALRAWLAESGIHPRFVRKTSDGVVVTQHSAENARWALGRSQPSAEPIVDGLDFQGGSALNDSEAAQDVLLGADPASMTAPDSADVALESGGALHTHGNVSFQKGANALPKELRAAQALADRGYNVQFVVTANQLGIENENTADTIVEGVGQVEFYTPTTTKEDNVVRMIIRKRKQAPILLMQTDMDAAIIQSIADRLWGNASARDIAKLFIQRSDGTVVEMSRPGRKD